ncbi:hypothetical protein O181_058112 [Austropuccinia psidii MF-1]|uniref:Reverse transcriptase RNase H-like domain-containing protein n=1 Tax=Austropuccinia psidii MF-1 TaxID=1389203 RepID=A0A9Q3HW40_9BASI|nr:hypothetical protein [Austropuccinia psidii MF-1]
MELPPFSFHASLEENLDEEEEPKEVETLLKVVPPDYHHSLDVFSKVKAEKLPPHSACDHQIELEGLLPPEALTIGETDASDYSLGAGLSQVNDSGKHPISIDSRKLFPPELNYEIHDKVLFGIVWALKRWRAFLFSLSNPFEVLTDHSSLQYFISSKVLTHHQVHWAEFLSEFHFTITYCRGRLATLPGAFKHQEKVDFISKNSQTFHQVIKRDGIQESRFFSMKVEIFSDLVDQIQKEVWRDKDYKEILKQLARGESGSDYSLEPQAKLWLFKDRVVIPRNE